MANKLLLSLIVVVVSILFARWYTSPEPRRSFNRVYRDSTTVRDEYNSWTQDGILEYYWGHHIHLGYYPTQVAASSVDFRQAKVNFTVQLFQWAYKVTSRPLPRASDVEADSRTLLDAGCGFGGSTMLITSRYGFSRSVGITLSDSQVARAQEILVEEAETYPRNKEVSFQVADVLKIDETEGLAGRQFDLVWSLEMEPHVPDKQAMLDQLLSALKPGGLLILGCWNIRDVTQPPGELTQEEREMVKFLEIEWGHPYFWSIKQYDEALRKHPSVAEVYQDDWSKYANPSWWESIIEMVRRPKMLIWAMVHPSCWNDRWGDLMGLINMRKAFGDGLMQYGVFAVTKKA